MRMNEKTDATGTDPCTRHMATGTPGAGPTGCDGVTGLPVGQPLQVKQYRRMEGVLDLPPHAVVKTVTARVLDGATVRTTQTMAIE